MVDWSQTSYSDSIANFETQFGEDLDGDSSVGIDISSISLKTSDTKGDKLAITSDGSLYIAKEDGSYIQIVESWSGSSVSLMKVPEMALLGHMKEKHYKSHLMMGELQQILQMINFYLQSNRQILTIGMVKLIFTPTGMFMMFH